MRKTKTRNGNIKRTEEMLDNKDWIRASKFMMSEIDINISKRNLLITFS